jgi:hypothetical protein
MEPAVLRQALLEKTAVIYSFAVDHLRNVTETYRRRMLDGLPETAPRRVEIGNPLYAFALGPEWGSIVSGSRWVPDRATLRLGPRRNGTILVLDGTFESVKPFTAMSGGVNPERRNTHLIVTLRVVTPGGVASAGIVAPDKFGPERAGDESKDRFHRLFELPATVPRDRDLEVEIDLPGSTLGDSRLALETVAIE